MSHKDIENVGGYPSPFAKKEIKDSKAYGLKYFQSMYKDWQGDGSSSIKGKKRRFDTARAYANGTQGDGKYRSMLNSSGDQSYMNLNWDILSIVPKFVDVIVNGLVEQEYEMKVTAMDTTSLNKRLKDKDKMFVEMINKDYNEEFARITDQPTQEKASGPESIEELDLFMNLNYKQKNELAMEQALTAIKALNDYDEIRAQLIRDLTVCNMAVAKTHTDPVRGIKHTYVDPSNFIHSYSKAPDCKDLYHAGEIRRMTIGEIRRLAGPSELSEPQLEEVARRYAGRDNNPSSFRSGSNFNASLGYDEYDYDMFTIEVLDGCFKSDYNVVYEKKENKHGHSNIYRKKDGYEAPKRSKFKREIVEQPAAIYYTGIYLVGTEHVIGYGPAKNMVRKTSTLDDTPCPYIVYIPNVHKSSGKSLVERMIPFADQIQLAHLKMQLVIAKARPKGAAFELGSLENVGKGDGATFTPLELQDIYDQTGNIYYRRQDDEGTQSQSLPIQELENGIGKDMQSLIAIYNHNLQVIRDVTGINEARDATQPSNKALIGTQKLALMASNNATKHINKGELSITRRIAEHTILRLQDLIKYSPLKKKYINMLGEAVVESISIGKDFHLNEFGLDIEMAPDEEERQMFEQNIQMSLQQKELRLEDAIFLRSIKNVKMANQTLVIRRGKYLKEAQAAEQQKMQGAQQLEQQKAAAQQQAIAQSKELDSKASAELENLKHEHEMERLELEYKLKMELKTLENSGLTDKEQIKVEGSNKVQETANAGKKDLMPNSPPTDGIALPGMDSPMGGQPLSPDPLSGLTEEMPMDMMQGLASPNEQPKQPGQPGQPGQPEQSGPPLDTLI